MMSPAQVAEKLAADPLALEAAREFDYATLAYLWNVAEGVPSYTGRKWRDLDDIAKELTK